MSWHYLQGQEVESWEVNSSDGPPYALSKLMPIAVTYFSPGSETEFSQDSRSGMTSPRSTEGRGAEKSTSSVADSPAKTSRVQAKEPESKGKSPDSGRSLLGSLAKYDPATSTWKTPQISLLGDSESFSETWPRWGFMRAGVCWARATPELPTDDSESGFMATPTAKANQLAPSMMKHPGCRAWLPTPTATSYGTNQGGAAGRVGKVRESLNTMARRNTWPTPHGLSGSQGQGGGEFDKAVRQTVEGGGTLNPNWVEWLMGWPIGWTDLEPLEMDKFQQWFDSHGRR